MTDKRSLLDAVTELARAGSLTEQELIVAFRDGDPTNAHHDQTTPLEASTDEVPRHDEQGYHFNAADLLYYLGAIVVYISIAVFASQAWETVGSLGRIFLTLGVGFIFWAVAVRLLTDKNRTEQAEGIGGAVLLIGSLSVIAGVGVTISEIIADADDLSLGIPFIGALIVASLHFGMDMLAKRTVTSVFGVISAVSAYIILVVWLVGDSIESVDFWGIVSVIAGILAIGAGATIYKYEPHRQNVRTVLWALGGFTAISALFTLTFASDFKWIWQLLFPAVLYGTFVASIKSRSKNFLYTGAIFLFAFVMTVSFQYFGDGVGVAAALMISGFGIIGSGVLAQRLRKKYF